MLDQDTRLRPKKTSEIAFLLEAMYKNGGVFKIC